eukprot:CAMPEP_0171293540 /NCGR_PEP_ID=MMETSP0816-20121228/1832_1 /TAXON_ID=420281 /ORGANISM="Proboscia inermis, Strain CCAP1064/1" /LENGTH=172 /DNA_ID=CAMNT_0011764517 /DNA_START=492 /DNA_END=1010 /DNA_ORIENTATION=-
MALTFLSRRAAGLVRSNNVAMTRMFSSEAAEASGNMSFSFNLPHESIYLNAKVAQVIVPGAGGEYGVTADHVPTVAQLKPGVLQIMHGDGSDAEKFFVSGGFALTHANSATDVTCPEAVRLDDIDPNAVSSNFEAAKASYAAAEVGSIAQAEAQIEIDVNRAMGAAVGLSLV